MGQQRETKTLARFVSEFNQAPLELSEFAEYASEVKDCLQLADAARHFLDAKRSFERVMREHEVEVG